MLHQTKPGPLPSPQSVRPSLHLDWQQELWPFLSVAWPLAATCLLEFLPALGTISIVGRECSKHDLAAAALGTMYSNVTGYSVSQGLTTALDTLAAQAVGAGRPASVGLHLQRGIWIMLVALVPMFLLSLWAEPVLLLLGQPPALARDAARFSCWLLPGLPAFIGFELLRKCLQALGDNRPMLAIAGFGSIVTIVLTQWAVVQLGVGFLGAAAARSAALIMSLGLLVSYTIISDMRRHFWQGWSCRGFVEWGGFLGLALPGAFIVCLEWWLFELLLLLSGMMPDRENALGACAVLFNLSSVIFMCYLGIAITVHLQIGAALGANQPNKAASVLVAALMVATVFALGVASSLIAARRVLIAAFTHDPDIQQQAEQAIWAMAVYQVLDAANNVGKGAMKGAGQQWSSAAVLGVAYYGVGLPAAYWTGIECHGGLTWLWLSVAIALGFASFVQLTMIWRWDWQQVAQRVSIQAIADDNQHNDNHNAEYGTFSTTQLTTTELT